MMLLPLVLSTPSLPCTNHLLTCRMMIRKSGIEVELSVVDEDVLRSRSVYCDQCRVGGMMNGRVQDQLMNWIQSMEWEFAGPVLTAGMQTTGTNWSQEERSL